MSDSIQRLRRIMERLRDPVDGCPWDLQQTWKTIVPHTIEEAYELADAIENGTIEEVRDELGDLLFQVIFQSRIAEEDGLFDLHQVAERICDKLERRHPHVFGEARSEVSLAEQSEAWERHKQAERGTLGALDGVTLGLPALTRASKLGRRASAVGFDWPDARSVLEKVREEVGEVEQAIDENNLPQMREELGDLLFAVAQAARRCGLDPEGALREANSKFERRFRHMEAALERRGLAPVDVDIAELEALWSAAKRDGA